MAGLLGTSWDDPRTLGLLGVAASLLESSGSSPRPIGLGEAMGRAVGTGMGAYQQGIGAQARNRLLGLQEQQTGLQTAELQRKAQQQAQQQQYLQQLIAGLPPEQRAAAMVAPEKFAESMVPQAPKLETIFTPEGQEQKAWVRGPGVDPQPVGGAKQAPMPWEYERGPDGQPRMRPGVFRAKSAIAEAGAGKGVSFVQEKEEDKAVGKAFGERYTKIQEAGFTAQSRVTRLDRMEQLLEGLETGRLTPAMTEVRSFFDSLGIKGGAGLDKAQAIAALSNEMALQARNTAEGAGMPGSMSDADRQFLVQTVPGLGRTPGGNELLIETNRRLAKRDMQIAKVAREYRKKHGRLDEGFYDELQAYADANPLFADLQAQKPSAAPAMPSAPGGLPPGWSVKER